jgi:hypothetical protein
MANKIHDLVQRLIDRTDEGKVNWEITADKGIYQAAFPNYSVRLFTRRNYGYDDSVDYVMTIHDETGEMIDEITDVGLRDSGFDDAYKRMVHLYNEARRKAVGVEKVIDDLLSELGD